VLGVGKQGSNLHQACHHPQFLALQLKARMEGIPTPVYRLQSGIIWSRRQTSQNSLPL
jgi:hypothetical protein